MKKMKTFGLKKLGLFNPKEVYRNLTPTKLIEMAIQRGEGVLSSTGALSVTTGKYTGRSPEDKFDFNDFLKQIEQIKKMGNLKDLASMIPGVGKAVKDLDIDDNAFKGVEAIIKSMTPKERTNPEIINTSRRQRIAKGSGTNIQEVNRLMKQFDQTRKMMKMVTGNGMANMMSRMKGMKMPGM